MRNLSLELIFSCSYLFCLVCVASGFVPVDNYLIDCGSARNSSIGNRTFLADNFYSDILSSTRNILASTNSSSLSSSYDSTLYLTARIFDQASHYTFPIQENGRHLIRLYFFPFVFGEYNLSTAKFSVHAQNFTLLKDYQLDKGSVVKEYSFNITTNQLVLTFTPNVGSFAFVNALEVISLPIELIPDSASVVETPGVKQNLQDQALETALRVNMGNKTVHPQKDTLWRRWVSDNAFLKHSAVSIVSNIDAVTYKNGNVTENIAPASVYGTAAMLASDRDLDLKANLTWLFSVDAGFDYLVRFHFCDIVNSSFGSFFFNVYINSWFAYRSFDLSTLTSNIIGNPYYFDVITSSTSSSALSVSVGPSSESSSNPMAILNGLEIMKISNSQGSLETSDSEIRSSKTKSRSQIILITGLSGGICIVLVFVLVLFLVCRKRRKIAVVGHTKEEDNFVMNQTGDEHSNGLAQFSNSKFGYRYPLRVIEEATNNFSEDLIIGTGGFGKVYKGILRDGTKVAVKRGQSKSQQGLTEFRTEIEMLSQFRHRHLVSLIGYCDEQNEMIIIYEFMENGTLKSHLYCSDLPVLSWKQRLEICIGSAKGLHYLHTGSTRAIIHRDVKSANILLDENLMAKVADFGLSKTGPEIDQTHVSTAVKGSFGYLDPEYLTRQQLTEKSDVYSFGVVMLEILCGRAVIDPSLPREKVNLVEWVMKWRERGRIQESIDTYLVDQASEESLWKFMEIAEKCLAKSGLNRPSMGDVLWNLECALQVQVKEEKQSDEDGLVTKADWVGYQATTSSASTAQFSVGSLGNLAGVSMSKVFANMVNEEMR
ncbi:Protein kinase domain-containing protein [Psidium guajava]|nr:Protein kinase domain-containing protein [Psidium guajava]